MAAAVSQIGLSETTAHGRTLARPVLSAKLGGGLPYFGEITEVGVPSTEFKVTLLF
jgi:hypothetical protein